jgi:hypothetical protein
MSSAAGPNISTSGLMLSVDMTNTSKTWLGQPTTNQFAIPTPDVNGFVTFSVQGTAGFQRIYSGTYGGYEIQPSDIVYKYVLGLGPTACHYHGNTISVTAGQTPTWSFDYYIDPTTTGYPVTNYLANMESSIGVGAALTDPTPGTIGVWKRATQTSAAASSTGTFNAYLYPGACGTQMATGGFILYKNPQVELNSFATPFVAGTRSTTSAVLDPILNNTITATSLTYASDNTVSYNGSSNYMTATGPGFTSSMAAYTIMFWARRDAENRMPVSSLTGTSFYWYGDNSWKYQHGGVSGEYYYAKPTSIPLGTWGHYCVVYNGVNVSIYRQGVLQGSQATTGTADWSMGMQIGYWQGGTGYQWSGKIDTVTMYSRALTATEVEQSFNALRTRYGL